MRFHSLGTTEVLGVAAFTDRCDGTPFSADDLGSLRLLAGPAALALTMQKLRQAADEVTRLASIDPLTGLFNRRYFDTDSKPNFSGPAATASRSLY